MVDWLAGLEVFQNLLHNRLLFLQLLHLQILASTSCLLDKVLKRLLHEFDILDAKLVGNDVQVTDGVDVSLDVDDLGIVKAPNHLEDGIDGTDVGQESVAETGTGGCTTG